MTTGKVYIIGAGPGDPGLLTLKGKWILQRADVVLMDHLVHSTLLNYCPEHTQIIYVGKQKGKHSTTQKEINKKLIFYAKQHAIVVRLKGGDPFIFGRVGEELNCLNDHNIPFEVIPGVSSAIAAPGYAGIPLTYRNLSRSVAFVTGTLKRDQAAIDIPNADTLVFLMGFYHLNELVQQLLDLSRFNANTPIAAISHASTSKQETIYSTLGNVCENTAIKALTTPVLLVVGNIIQVKESCSFIQYLPFFGQRIIIGRPFKQAQHWIQHLQLLGADVVAAPLIKTRINTSATQQLTADYISKMNAFCFTSQTAVHYFFQTLINNNLDIRTLSSKHIASIGEQTTATLNQYHIIPDSVSPSPSQLNLAQSLPLSLENHQICYPTSDRSATDLQDYCKKQNININRINLYTTELIDCPYLNLEPNDFFIFSSPSIVDSFLLHYPTFKESITAIAIGPTTANYLKDHFFSTIIVASEPTIDAITTIVQKHILK